MPWRRSLLLGGVSTSALATLGHSGTAAAGLPTRSAAESAADFDLDSGNFIRDLIAQFHPDKDVIAPMDVTVLHRFIHLSTTARFDATAPYHPNAVGVHSRLGRRPSSEASSNRNKNIAAVHANYQVIKGSEPGRESNFRDLMIAVGLNPDDESEDRTSPVGIGNLAGKAVVAAAKRDGMNQLGDEGREFNGQPFEDYTGYRPVKTAFDLLRPGQPLALAAEAGAPQPPPRRGAGDKGIFTVQQFVTPQTGAKTPDGVQLRLAHASCLRC
ncbi:DUF6851 domain-containing protein [Streptomyces sp. NPDC005151]